MAPLWSYQPFKALLTALVLAGALVYFVALAIYYIPKRLRPHPQWSLHTSLGCAFYWLMFKYISMTRMKPAYALKVGSLKKRHVLVNPALENLYTGVLDHPTIRPVPWGAIWFPQAPTLEDIKNRTVVLHLPGGAYAMASVLAQTGVFPSTVYLKKLNALTFYAQYRVAAVPETRFPAAIQDAVTFYSYLLSLGVPAKNIIISGDSAGGNLVIALLRYIEENKSGVSTPRGAITWSAWFDVTSESLERYKRSKKAATDLVPWQILEWGMEVYPPPSSDPSSAAARPYISPAQHPFALSTPLIVQAGSAEIFYEDAKKFAHDMESIAGNKVRFWGTPNVPYDLILYGQLLGLRQEAEDVLQIAEVFF